jgi:hypothetical protein
MKNYFHFLFTCILVVLSACSSSTQHAPTQSIPEALPTPTEIEEQVTFIRTQGGERRDRGINLLQTADGGYAIVGYTSSGDAVEEDVFLVRLNPQGEFLWSQIYGCGSKSS